jgi:diaminopimelate decarboxylase
VYGPSRDAVTDISANACNYNRRPLPVEVLVDEGRWRVLRRRQTVDDLLTLENVERWLES